MLNLAAAGTDPGASILPLYYIVATLGGIAAMLFGGLKVYGKIRARAFDEGREKSATTSAIDDNSRVGRENTAAIRDLTAELRKFAAEINQAVSSHGGRLDRLEEWRANGAQRVNH